MSRKTLIREADRVFSLYIRNRGETFGYNHCFTCGKYLPVTELQAAHFISRRYTNVRWHPLNVWPGCNHCNVTLGGNLKIYERRLVEMYSQDAVDALWELARTNDGVTDGYIYEIIQKYRPV